MKWPKWAKSLDEVGWPVVWKTPAEVYAMYGKPETDGVICKYSLGWSGACGKPTKGGDFCPEHAKMECFCGSPATQSCPISGSLVCGAPLCGLHTKCVPRC